MKSLRTVIEVMEACQNEGLDCFLCPLRHETECEMKNVALAYLKEYQSVKDEDNSPLTWDELKGMEGKPVWIELLGNDHWKGWDVIAGFDEDDFGAAMVTVHNDDYYKLDLGTTWQAYRKERNDS